MNSATRRRRRRTSGLQPSTIEVAPVDAGRTGTWTLALPEAGSLSGFATASNPSPVDDDIIISLKVDTVVVATASILEGNTTGSDGGSYVVGAAALVEIVASTGSTVPCAVSGSILLTGTVETTFTLLPVTL